MGASDYIAIGSLVVAFTALVVRYLESRNEPLESVISGLRGDRKAVTYAAQTIRLADYLKRDRYRQSLIASLLLAWNFETSNRARAAVLSALVEAKTHHPTDYRRVVDDLQQRFETYEKVVAEGDMERGHRRLKEVTEAVDKAVISSTSAQRP